MLDASSVLREVAQGRLTMEEGTELLEQLHRREALVVNAGGRGGRGGAPGQPGEPGQSGRSITVHTQIGLGKAALDELQKTLRDSVAGIHAVAGGIDLANVKGALREMQKAARPNRAQDIAALMGNAHAPAAAVLRQRDFVDACARFSGGYPPGGVWLQRDGGEPAELVDYTLTPWGQSQPLAAEMNERGETMRPPDSLDARLVLARYETAAGRARQEALWLVGLEAELDSSPRARLILKVTSGYGPLSVVPVKPPAPALKAADQLRFMPLETVQGLARMNRGGELQGWQWAWVEPGEKDRQEGKGPLLCVDQEAVLLPSEWADLYARLLLGEE